VVRDGRVVDVDVWQVFFNDAFWYEALHMLLAAYVVAGFSVAGVYAVGMLRGRRDRYHRLGLLIPLTTGAVAIPLQIVMGDVIARHVFESEPAKFAAIEILPDTRTHAPETLGGVLVDGKVRGGLSIPDGGSLLSGFSPDTRVRGLDAIPRGVRPPDELVSVVHLSFDLMVATGFALGGLALWFALSWWRSRVAEPNRWLLRAVAVSGPVSIVSLESGWVVTEVGRQPWTVVGLLLTRDAVQTSGNLWPLFGAAVLIYAGVTVGAVYALRALRRRWARGEATSVPYGPQDAAGTSRTAERP
jgi:cytochrome bd ubiquinol oxidase subunit I